MPQGYISMKKPRLIFLSIFMLSTGPLIAGDIGDCKKLNQESYSSCKRLSDAGDPDGQFGLGMLLLEGAGVERNYTKSFDLMYKAAMQGHAPAQLQVGQAYVNGQGVERDYEEAYAWFMVAKENGNPLANQGISFLEGNQLVAQSRMAAVTQRANDLYSGTKNQKGFGYDGDKRTQSVSGLGEYCDMIMPTVDGIINYRKYDKPQSSARQLMIGMTDEKAIEMMNGVIQWVWASNIPVADMSSDFRMKCMSRNSEVAFIFQ